MTKKNVFFSDFLSDFVTVLYTYSFSVDRSKNGYVTVSQPAFNALSWCPIDQDIKSNKGDSVLSYQVYEKDHNTNQPGHIITPNHSLPRPRPHPHRPHHDLMFPPH
jgi:hypothetical protein